jgi:hypothetical protein
MRRVALVALLFLAFAPAAHAGCGATSTAGTGKAPLLVTFTATCEATTYSWDFGDGQQAVGRSVQHLFTAGAWRPALTTESGAEPAPVVTAISVALKAPRIARYAEWVTLRATVTPRVPVTLRGRRFVHGKLRVRVLGTTPWIADALGVESAPVRILVAPRLVVHISGTPYVGSSVRVVAPLLALGARGASVRALEQRLSDLRYAIRRDGYFGSEDLEAVYAFQKVEGLDRTGEVTPTVWARLLTAKTPRPRYGGPDHIEIDKTRQVLYLVHGSEVTLIVATSTGATGNTPVGTFHVYRKVGGYDWVLYYPSYFLRGFAVHGYPDVPPYPASHGCARIPMWIAQTVYAQVAYGSEVIVYT